MMGTTLSPLKRITLKGYKSICELDLSLSSLNILIGANGSGKSNFISVFTLLNQMAEGRLQEYVATRGGADTILHFGRKGTKSLSVCIEIAEIVYAVELIPTVQDQLVIHEVCRVVMPGSPLRGDLFDKSSTPFAENDVRESILRTTNASGNPEYRLGEALRQWRVFHFNDTSDSAKVRGASNINDNDHLRPDGSNLTAMLYMMQKKYEEHYRNIVDVIRLVAPFFDDFQLRPDPLNEHNIRMAWRQRGSEQYFDASALSDGTLRFICLATLLMQPQLPSLILLDEPELGLHPYAISLVAGMLRSVSKSVQIILSTQSTTLVDCFEPEDIIVVDQQRSESVFRHITTAELGTWLDEYSIAELWEKNVLGGRP